MRSKLGGGGGVRGWCMSLPARQQIRVGLTIHSIPAMVGRAWGLGLWKEINCYVRHSGCGLFSSVETFFCTNSTLSY